MNAFTLKLIALGSMLYDHITALWPLELILWLWFFPDAEALPGWVEVLCDLSHYIGKIAAPIFLFSLTQGYRHTRDWKKYALRLLLFACLAEWPYYLLFESCGNILFTIFLGLLTLRSFDYLEQKCHHLGWVLVVTLFLLLEWLHFPEGGGKYILFIVVFYQTEHWSWGRKVLLWLVLYPLSRWKLFFFCYNEGFSIRSVQTFLLNAFGPLLGVGLTLLYNGEKGPERKGLKYLWYIAYPAHLLLLALWKLHRGY